MNNCIGLVGLLFALSACTVTTYRGGEDAFDIEHVCIVENPDAEVPKLVSVIERRIAAHGLQSQRVSSVQGCVHTLEYTAVQSGDREPYLDFARFTLRQNGESIGTAKYQDRGGPPEKRSASLSSKVAPIIDELLGLDIAEN